MDKKIHELPSLSYEYNALEPYIDEETMKLHHGKHHLAYVSKLNEALEKYPELFLKSIEELIKDLNDVPEEIKTAVQNNGGGHFNHSMFWQSMSPNAGGAAQKVLGEPRESEAGREPKGELLKEIQNSFGSFEDFKQKFEDTGLKRFGSGWVWLIKNRDGILEIISTANQDNPISDGNTPIIGNDIWEHAYYLKYKNVRADYLKAWWNVVNWEEVGKRFTKN